MTTLRALYPQALEALAAGDAVTLSPEESHHLLRVRRARSGQRVDLYNGQGRVCEGRLLGVQDRRACVEVTAVATHPRAAHLILAQALPKPKVFETLVQKATELGVAEVLPFTSAHSEAAPEPQTLSARRERWNAIALESLKQCGNPWLPEVHAPVTFADVLTKLHSGAGEGAVGIVAALTPGARPLLELWAGLERPVAPRVLACVGPEGDLSGEEYAELLRAGAEAVTLGPQVLRVDTAAIVLCGSLQQLLSTAY